ncbi:MAG: hypothetical protein PF795_08815 [Kiritimatiellae bacterium]|nr:hypothetical protein [Kiritimatiellia bacterium]
MKAFLPTVIPFLLLIPGLMTGCVSGGSRYQVNVGNGNPTLPIQDVHVKADGEALPDFPVIAPSKVAAGRPLKGDLPDQITVSWKDPNGRHFEKTLPVKSEVRPDFRGQLVFEITADNKLTMTEVASEGSELSTMPWAMPESWEGSIQVPGMNE